MLYFNIKCLFVCLCYGCRITITQKKVLVGGVKSDPDLVVSVVPKGTVLEPLPFLLFINDLPSLRVCKIRPFSDDWIVYTCTIIWIRNKRGTKSFADPVLVSSIIRLLLQTWLWKLILPRSDTCGKHWDMKVNPQNYFILSISISVYTFGNYDVIKTSWKQIIMISGTYILIRL